MCGLLLVHYLARAAKGLTPSFPIAIKPPASRRTVRVCPAVKHQRLLGTSYVCTHCDAGCSSSCAEVLFLVVFHKVNHIFEALAQDG